MEKEYTVYWNESHTVKSLEELPAEFQNTIKSTYPGYGISSWSAIATYEGKTEENTELAAGESINNVKAQWDLKPNLYSLYRNLQINVYKTPEKNSNGIYEYDYSLTAITENQTFTATSENNSFIVSGSTLTIKFKSKNYIVIVYSADSISKPFTLNSTPSDWTYSLNINNSEDIRTFTLVDHVDSITRIDVFKFNNGQTVEYSNVAHTEKDIDPYLFFPSGFKYLIDFYVAGKSQEHPFMLIGHNGDNSAHTMNVNLALTDLTTNKPTIINGNSPIKVSGMNRSFKYITIKNNILDDYKEGNNIKFDTISAKEHVMQFGIKIRDNGSGCAGIKTQATFKIVSISRQ